MKLNYILDTVEELGQRATNRGNKYILFITIYMIKYNMLLP
jgi:hypothetical protein